MPESDMDLFLSTSLFKSIKDTYPTHSLYVATKPEYNEILDGNPYIKKVIQYIPQMDNILWLEGTSDHNGYFDIAFLPYINSQRVVNFLHNGKTKINYYLKDK